MSSVARSSLCALGWSVIPCFVIDLVTKAGCVDDCQGDTGSFFVEFKFCSNTSIAVLQGGCMYDLFLTDCDGLYPNSFFQVGIYCIVCVLSCQDALAAEGIDKSRTT